MSNLIKSSFINLADNGVRIIDNNEKKEVKIIGFTEDEEEKDTSGEFKEIDFMQKSLEETDFAQISAAVPDLDEAEIEEIAQNMEDDDFVPLVMTDEELAKKEKVERILQENSRNNIVEEAKEEAQKLIDDSKIKADDMISDASARIEQMRQEAYEEGKAKGYEDGMFEAKKQLELREAELEINLRAKKEEMTNYLDMVEDKYVDVIIGLIKKISGVLLQTRKDILLYLIKSAVNGMEKSNSYNIRVSSKDLYEIESKKEDIIEAIGGQVSIDFSVEEDLEQGDCIIETENQMIDCSFNTQINTLIEDLKLLN